MERSSTISRKTTETDIELSLTLEGHGKALIDCQIGFLRHLLETFAKHGQFDLKLKASGDLDVDQHHLVEDIGLVLGAAFTKALGDKRGIKRVGSCFYPMDESLARAVVDLSGRPFLVCDAALTGWPLVSTGGHAFQSDCFIDFWQAFVSQANCALHLDIIRGRSDHHKMEALFKAAARALREACAVDKQAADQIPSTKGTIC